MRQETTDKWSSDVIVIYNMWLLHVRTSMEIVILPRKRRHRAPLLGLDVICFNIYYLNYGVFYRFIVVKFFVVKFFVVKFFVL